jgi:trigger factor
VEFRAEYPEKSGGEGLAGKPVDFRLRIHEVKRRELPKLDDEMAKDLGEFEDLASLRARVREDLEARKRHEAERSLRQTLMDKILLENTVMLPEVLVEREVIRRLEDIARSMVMQGIDPEKSEIDWKELRKAQEEPARKSVHARLVLDAIAEAEDIKLEPRAVDERIRLEAQRIGESPDKLKTRLREQSGLEALTTQLLREKTLDYLTSVANIHSEE